MQSTSLDRQHAILQHAISSEMRTQLLILLPLINLRRPYKSAETLQISQAQAQF